VREKEKRGEEKDIASSPSHLIKIKRFRER
jgi:hypothetical protein